MSCHLLGVASRSQAPAWEYKRNSEQYAFPFKDHGNEDKVIKGGAGWFLGISKKQNNYNNYKRPTKMPALFKTKTPKIAPYSTEAATAINSG